MRSDSCILSAIAAPMVTYGASNCAIPLACHDAERKDRAKARRTERYCSFDHADRYPAYGLECGLKIYANGR
jgi:hypothetical protein